MNRLLKLLIVAAFLNALSWIIIIPIWQYPDEQAHFAQVQFIAEIGNIEYSKRALDTSYEVALSEKILKTERDGFGNNSFTYHPEFKLPYQESLYGINEDKIVNLPQSARSQMVKREATLNPPLYYNLAALVYKMFSSGSLFSRVLAIRLMSALIFLGTIIVAYKIGQLLFKDKILPIALAAIVSSKPMLVFASTGVLPDTLVNFLFSLFILISLQIIARGWTYKKVFLLLVVIALGAATRQNFLISLFILPLVLVQQIITNPKARRSIIVSIIIFSVVLFIASFFVPALDFIHRLDYPESSRKIPNNPLANLSYFDHLIWTLKHSIAEVWPWYWGVYKWLSLTLPPLVYQIINRLIPLAALGLLIYTIKILKKRSKKEISNLFFLSAALVIYFLVLTTFDYLYRKNNGFSFGIQGRYFFPVVVPTLALVLIGATTLGQTFLKTYAKFIPLALVVLFVTFNIFSLSFLASSYYDTSSLAIFINQVSQYKPLVVKGLPLVIILVANLTSLALFLFSFAKYIIVLNESSRRARNKKIY